MHSAVPPAQGKGRAISMAHILNVSSGTTCAGHTTSLDIVTRCTTLNAPTLTRCEGTMLDHVIAVGLNSPASLTVVYIVTAGLIVYTLATMGRVR